MMNEREMIEQILKDRGVILPGNVVDLKAFNKLVTEPWLYNKSIRYGFVSNPNLWDFDINETPKKINEEKQEENTTVSEEIAEEQPIENQQVEEIEVVKTDDENEVKTEESEVKVEEPVAEEQPVTKTKKKSQSSKK